jgi:hypothetical protein
MHEIISESVETPKWLSMSPQLVAQYVSAPVEKIEKAQKQLLSLIRDGNIEVWRAVKLTPGYVDDLWEGQPIGRSFTYRKDFAIAYDGGSGGRLYRVHAKIPVTSVNWTKTIELFGSGEYEIRAHDNQPLTFLGIDRIDDLGRDIEALRADLVGKMLKTGTYP